MKVLELIIFGNPRDPSELYARVLSETLDLPQPAAIVRTEALQTADTFRLVLTAPTLKAKSALTAYELTTTFLGDKVGLSEEAQEVIARSGITPYSFLVHPISRMKAVELTTTEKTSFEQVSALTCTTARYGYFADLVADESRLLSALYVCGALDAQGYSLYWLHQFDVNDRILREAYERCVKLLTEAQYNKKRDAFELRVEAPPWFFVLDGITEQTAYKLCKGFQKQLLPALGL